MRRADDRAGRRDVDAEGVITAGDARNRTGDNARPVGEAPFEIGIGDAGGYAPYGRIKPARQRRLQLGCRLACSALTNRSAGGLFIPVRGGDCAVYAAPDQAVDSIAPIDCTRSIGLCDRASLKKTDQSADITAASRDRRSDIALCDRAVGAPSDQPADIAAPADRAGYIGLINRAAAAEISHQHGDKIFPGDKGALQADLADRRGANSAEQADIIGRRTVNEQIGNYMAVPVEVAGEVVRAVADRIEARPAVPADRAGRIDVVGELPVGGEESGRRADPLQAVDVGDEVGRRGRAGAACDPQEAGPAGDGEVAGVEVRQRGR